MFFELRISSRLGEFGTTVKRPKAPATFYAWLPETHPILPLQLGAQQQDGAGGIE